MQIFNAIYKKENTLQCQFSDNFIHPRYFGSEFPIGQHLITAISYDREYVMGLYKDLIQFYINFLDAGTEDSQALFEKALFKIDNYCIYLHETTIKLLTLIEATHPCYSLLDSVSFLKDFEPTEAARFSEQYTKIKTSGRERPNEILSLWSIASELLLDKFESLTNVIKNDIYEICNAPAKATGLDRLHHLDYEKKNILFQMEFPMRLNYSLSKSVNSKFFIADNLGASNVVYSVAIHTVKQLMYYDLFTILENDMPLKICKNCNTPFIPKGRADSLYCDRIMPGFKNKCSAIGSINAYKNCLSDVETEYYATHRRYNTRVSRNPLLKTEFATWKVKAKEKLTAYRNGEISANEFKEWFMDDEWTKI